jgi:hypothetical protein
MSAGGIEIAVLVALCVVLAFFSLAPQRPRRWDRQTPFRVISGGRDQASGPPDSADQLRWVMAAEFEAIRVMSLDEYQVFKAVEAEVQALHLGHRVFSQTALGEVIRSKDRQAHSAINSKRVDVLVIGRDGRPVLAIEYQGPGHYQRDAAARDAVKKEALRRAGVGYLEVFDAAAAEDIRGQVRLALTRAAA